MFKAFLDEFTPVTLIQMILSVLVIVAFIYQELTIHMVDTDLKTVVVGVVAFWFGGLTNSGINRLRNGVDRDV